MIIPHFLNYPLQSAKVIDFQFWRKSAEIIINKKHLSEEGLNQIVALKGVINKKLTLSLKKAFPTHLPLIRPSFLALACRPSGTGCDSLNNTHSPIRDAQSLEPYWCTGFIEGDGSFFIRTNPTKCGTLVSTSVLMSVCLDIREEPLLLRVKDYFGCGNVYSYTSRGIVEFKISKLENINSIVLHFTKYKLLGFKLYNFNIWKEIVDLINKKAHYTKEGILKIQSLKKRLNVWS